MEDQGVDVRMILKRIFKKWNDERGLVLSGSGYDRYRAFVKEVMNLRVP